MRRIKNAEVFIEDCVYNDTKTGEKKEYKRYKISINGIKFKVSLASESLDTINQLDFETEEVE